MATNHRILAPDCSCYFQQLVLVKNLNKHFRRRSLFLLFNCYIMKFGVVVFPGSNCDRDMQYALQFNLNKEVIMLWHKDKDISHFTTDDCIVLPGGFSFGDYLRCGAIARFSPMMQSVIEFANKGGKVLGVCNG